MDDLAGISRALASDALRWAMSYGDKRDEIDAAHHALARGDALRASGGADVSKRSRKRRTNTAGR